MQIDKTSWHYTIQKSFFRQFESSIPDNLCSYVRQLIPRLGAAAFAMTFTVFVLGYAAWGTGIGAIGLANALGSNTLLLASNADKIGFVLLPLLAGILTLAIVFGITLGAVAGSFVLIERILGFTRSKNIMVSKYVSEKVESSDNVLLKYISTKHKNICTKLTFK